MKRASEFKVFVATNNDIEKIFKGITSLCHSKLFPLLTPLRLPSSVFLASSALANAFCELNASPQEVNRRGIPDEAKNPQYRILRIAEPGLEFLGASALVFANISQDEKAISEHLIIFNTLITLQGLLGLYFQNDPSYMLEIFTGFFSNLSIISAPKSMLSGIPMVASGAFSLVRGTKNMIMGFLHNPNQQPERNPHRGLLPILSK